MSYNKWKRFFIVCVLILSFLVSPANATEKVTATPLPTPKSIPSGEDIIYPQYSQSIDILMLKSRLYENGYYIAQVNESDLRSNLLDDYTMLAISECCRMNNLPRSDYGILRDTWNVIIDNQIINAKEPIESATPAPADLYPHIYWESTDAAVFRLQEKLQSLGYGINMHRGIYDQEMLETVAEFCKLNNIAYDQRAEGGIAPWLQEVIITGDAVAFYTPTPSPIPEEAVTAAPSLSGKVQTYFTNTVSVLGLDVAMIFIWLFCLLIIVACIFIVVYFFMPDDVNSRRVGSSKQTRRTNGSIPSGQIEFIIDYQGNIDNYRCSIDHTLKIGRNVGNFPLNMDDIFISRKHCEIYYSNQNLMMRDYSSNGTTINGRPCANGEHLLSSGDVLQIGQHKITVLF